MLAAAASCCEIEIERKSTEILGRHLCAARATTLRQGGAPKFQCFFFSFDLDLAACSGCASLLLCPKQATMPPVCDPWACRTPKGRWSDASPLRRRGSAGQRRATAPPPPQRPPPCPPRSSRASRPPPVRAPRPAASSGCRRPPARNTCARTSAPRGLSVAWAARPLTAAAVLQRVGEKLGHGAFGEVIQALKEDTNEQVAVKQIPIKVDDDRHQDKIMVRPR